jgi:hypothetical protein
MSAARRRDWEPAVPRSQLIDPKIPRAPTPPRIDLADYTFPPSLVPPSDTGVSAPDSRAHHERPLFKPALVGVALGFLAGLALLRLVGVI